MAIEKTYSMIKPDGVRNGHIGEIVNRFERAGKKLRRRWRSRAQQKQRNQSHGLRFRP